MDHPLIETLAARVGRLERENRRWKYAGATVIVVGVVASAAGAFKDEVPKLVQAEQLQAERLIGRQAGPPSGRPGHHARWLCGPVDHRR